MIECLGRDGRLCPCLSFSESTILMIKMLVGSWINSSDWCNNASRCKVNCLYGVFFAQSGWSTVWVWLADFSLVYLCEDCPFLILMMNLLVANWCIKMDIQVISITSLWYGGRFCPYLSWWNVVPLLDQFVASMFGVFFVLFM